MKISFITSGPVILVRMGELSRGKLPVLRVHSSHHYLTKNVMLILHVHILERKNGHRNIFMGKYS